MIVRESVSFQRGLDPKAALGVGLQRLKDSGLPTLFSTIYDMGDEGWNLGRWIRNVWFMAETPTAPVYKGIIVVKLGQGSPKGFIEEMSTFEEHFYMAVGGTTASPSHYRDLQSLGKYFFVTMSIRPEKSELVTSFARTYGDFKDSQLKEDRRWNISKEKLIKL